MNEMTVREDSFDRGLEAKKALIQELYCKGSSPEECEFFFHCCKLYKLNPFMRQLQFVKMGGKMTMIVTIDGLRAIAERTGRYAPGRDTQFAYDKAGNLQAAKVFVKKQTMDGTWHEVSATALMCEYGKSSGPMWKQMPSVMLEKCAESRALRRAFSTKVAGLYTVEEVGKEGKIDQLEECDSVEEQFFIPNESAEPMQSVQPIEPIAAKSDTMMLAVQIFQYLQSQKMDMDFVGAEDIFAYVTDFQKNYPNIDILDRIKKGGPSSRESFLTALTDWSLNRENQDDARNVG
ncbi:MAG: phage recombination protein Bet [Parachlamydia sp.]|nr:phage recombination protein Bet [Parachlamydia sp.]